LSVSCSLKRVRALLVIEFIICPVAQILAGVRYKRPVPDVAIHQRGRRERGRGGRNFPVVAAEQITASRIFKPATRQVQVREEERIDGVVKRLLRKICESRESGRVQSSTLKARHNGQIARTERKKINQIMQVIASSRLPFFPRLEFLSFVFSLHSHTCDVTHFVRTCR